MSDSSSNIVFGTLADHHVFFAPNNSLWENLPSLVFVQIISYFFPWDMMPWLLVCKSYYCKKTLCVKQICLFSFSNNQLTKWKEGRLKWADLKDRVVFSLNLSVSIILPSIPISTFAVDQTRKERLFLFIAAAYYHENHKFSTFIQLVEITNRGIRLRAGQITQSRWVVRIKCYAPKTFLCLFVDENLRLRLTVYIFSPKVGLEEMKNCPYHAFSLSLPTLQSKFDIIYTKHNSVFLYCRPVEPFVKDFVPLISNPSQNITLILEDSKRIILNKSPELYFEMYSTMEDIRVQLFECVSDTKAPKLRRSFVMKPLIRKENLKYVSWGWCEWAVVESNGYLCLLGQNRKRSWIIVYSTFGTHILTQKIPQGRVQFFEIIFSKLWVVTEGDELMIFALNRIPETS